MGLWDILNFPVVGLKSSYLRMFQRLSRKSLGTFTDRKVASGKKVVVVGGGKSAIDNAVAAAKEGSKTTLVCRSWHWPVPRYLLNLVPFKYATYSRFGHWFLHPHHEEGAAATWLHGTCAPVKWLWWRAVELMFRVQFQLPRNITPEEGIETDLFSGGQILNYEFRDMVQVRANPDNLWLNRQVH